MDVLWLLVGLLGLWGGTEAAVRGAVRLAERLGLSQMFIALTVVSFGTNLPELVVAVDGAVKNLRGTESSGLIVGTAVGSCVCQIGAAIGLAAMVRFLAAGRQQVRHMAIGLFAGTGILALVGWDGVVNRAEGGVLLVAFVLFVAMLLDWERKNPHRPGETPTLRGNLGLTLLALAGGLAVVLVCADLVVDAALALATSWGVRQSLIGAVIVAFGTSLPELAISLNAAAKNKPGLSLGNVVGANVFDLLVPVGLAAMVAAVRFESQLLWFDLPYLALMSAAFVVFLARRKGLQRREGLAMLLLYLGYLAGRVVMD